MVKGVKLEATRERHEFDPDSPDVRAVLLIVLMMIVPDCRSIHKAKNILI